MLEDNNKAWDSKIKFSLWVDRVTTKRSLGLFPFQLVYGAKAVFPTHLSLLVVKLFQDYQEESDDMIRRIHQLVEVWQTGEKMIDRAHDRQWRIKQAFDRKNSKEDLWLGYLVLKWDVPR
jgi:hypothetical protein